MANYDVIIIGSGLAGLTAGLYAVGDIHQDSASQALISAGDGATAALAAPIPQRSIAPRNDFLMLPSKPGPVFSMFFP